MSGRILRANLLLAIAAVLLFGLSLMAGKAWVPLSAWLEGGQGWWIIFELRLPRAILAASIGAVLGLSGAVLQGYLRNPLADPALIGVSSSAALGAVTAIFLGFAGSSAIVFGSAMAGAALAMALLALLVGRSGSAIGFILAGMVLSSLSGSLTAFLISISPNPFATAEIVSWLMGALTDRSFDDILLALPFMAAGALILAFTGRALDLLNLGEETARSLGLNLGRIQAIIVVGLGLAVGASVAVSGVVGFVGLIVPHLVRPLVGQKPSALLLPSALGGAALLLAADSLVRLIPGPGEIRLGIAMALIGTPFFFALLISMRRRASWG
ncbi:MAG: ABC transporter permease [Sphingomonas sp. SCN 67-18]|uniref:FecCD family ABC transporter permease n=1 Tax=uncultured Sphingomonas sp. TaxID=158754 RepID=UPI00086E045D|nr:iron ABC transporter permease [Sphingomonas sp. SCN 67-18]ODU20712.1 MAG: ABC transporter permease [Sphingomonas sp. SCN 67-18]